MNDETKLIELSIKGDAQAFGQLVECYQSLICSITYSGTGNLQYSEDIAQETFIIAWKKLSDLRDKTKFRQWLCGIARNLLKNFYRQSKGSDISDHVIDQPIDAFDSPRNRAISREEEDILWRELEKIPETYREPLVLFYRQHQSIKSVSAALDINQETTKKRLERGRKLLQQQMIAFVEQTLENSNPSSAFSMLILSAITPSIPKLAAAGISSVSVKSGFLGKLASMVFSLPVISHLVGASIGGYFQMKWQTKNAESKPEKRLIIIAVIIFCFITVICNLFSYWIFQHAFSLPLETILITIIAFFVTLALTMSILGNIYNKKRKQIRKEQGSSSITHDTVLDKNGVPIIPRPIMALGLTMSNAGALLVPVLPFALLAQDYLSLLILSLLFGVMATSGVVITILHPTRCLLVTTLSMPIDIAAAITIITFRWNTWSQTNCLKGYLNQRTRLILTLFLLSFFIYAIIDWVKFLRKNSPRPQPINDDL